MSTAERAASMTPDELIAVIMRGLDADEQRARRAAAQWDDEDVRYEWEDLPDDVFAHARNYGPSRVLADVRSKREILAQYDARFSDDFVWQPILAAMARPYLDRETVRPTA